MPYLTLSNEACGRDAVTLYFEVHGAEGASGQSSTQPKVCMLMGFGAPGHVWAPQLADLLSAKDGEGTSPMAVCVLDNRGVGQSSCPKGWRHYSTDIMAQDTLAIMDHLGWESFHLIGHSMGSMVATKVAALSPQRVLSLSLISGTEGRWQAVPQSCAAIWLAIKKGFVRSVRGRASVDVQFHFSPSLLHEIDPVTKESRREVVIAEYMEAYLQEEEQPGHGTLGQLCAVMRHRLRKRDVKSIQLGQFPVLVIHGRQDILALPKYGEKLATRLQAPCIMLEGGHFVIREQAAAVNEILRSIVLGSSFANVERYPYMPFKHWVTVVDQLREQRAQMVAERRRQPHSLHAGPPEPCEVLASRRSWPLGIQLWRVAPNGRQP